MIKKFNFVLSILIVVTLILTTPILAFSADKMAVSGKTTVYTSCTSALSVKVNNKKVSSSKCSFSSSNKSVATVNKSGVVTGIKAGSSTITVKLKANKKAYKKVKITVKANTITTPATSLNFAKGCSNNLVIYVSGKRAGGGTVSFSSSNKKVATVDSTGKVTAKAKGTADITVKVKKNTAIYKKIKITVLDTKNFSIKPSSAPLNGMFLNFSTYNKYTKTYYAIRSYLEYFENHSDCTLNFAKGEYKISNALYVPSNTTMKFSNGVVLSKTNKTNLKNMPASGSMFILCAPSKAEKKGVVGKHNGVHDIKFLGEGNVTISMKNSPKDKIAVCVSMGHNKNVEYDNLTFTDLTYGHFIEMDACYNVKVTNCTFKNLYGTTEDSSNECINLDTPDKVTQGFHQDWSTYDCTPNENVLIQNCKFNNVQRGLGTHQYSKNQYHTNVTIDNCSFSNCKYCAMYAMNWKNLKITNNTFDGIGKDTNGKQVVSNSLVSKERAILFTGCYDGFKVTGNTFKNCFSVGCITTHQNKTGNYPMISNKIKRSEIEEMQHNNRCLENVDEEYVNCYANANGDNNYERLWIYGDAQ